MADLRFLPLAMSACLLASCTAIPSVEPPPAAPPPPPRPPVAQPVPPSDPLPPPTPGFLQPAIMDEPGLDAVILERASSLLRRFGQPRLDVAEGDMRKLQFTGEPCVLDIFLYPLEPGAEPVATWVEARRASDGAEVDRAACVRALSARR